jgi:hypothetical protein
MYNRNSDSSSTSSDSSNLNYNYRSSKTNLVNNNISVEHIKKMADSSSDENLIEDSMIKNMANLKTTETDMMFDCFGNKEKYIDKENVIIFEKDNNSPSVSSSSSSNQATSNTHNIGGNVGGEEYSDNLDDYIAKPKGGDHGPSYGDGPSNISKNTNTNQFQTEEEEMLAKLDMLRKLGELTQYGVTLSQNYSMNSDYKAMKYEYELHRSIRDKHNGIKWLSNMMLNVCYGLELANEKFDPFGFQLKGWSEQMNDDVGDYYDVFGELYEKYFKSGTPIPPEIKLMFMISGSAIKFHLAHAYLSNIPNLGDMLSKNPALAQKLQEQAAEKVRATHQKQNESFNNSRNNLHETAKKQAEDIQMLRDKQKEHLNRESLWVNQEENNEDVYQKQMKIQELQRQLHMQRSDTRSMYSTQNQNSGPSNQINIPPPVMPNSLKNNQDNRSTDSSVKYNPNLDKILNKKITNDTKSIISDLSEDLDMSIDSRGNKKPSTGRGRGRPRKNRITVNT